MCLLTNSTIKMLWSLFIPQNSYWWNTVGIGGNLEKIPVKKYTENKVPSKRVSGNKIPKKKVSKK